MDFATLALGSNADCLLADVMSQGLVGATTRAQQVLKAFKSKK